MGSIHHGKTMSQKTLIELLAEDPGSLGELLATIETLRTELQTGAIADWENPTLDRFLEAMQAWLQSMGPRVGNNLSWQFVEQMIRAAKTYE